MKLFLKMKSNSMNFIHYNLGRYLKGGSENQFLEPPFNKQYEIINFNK